MDKTLKRLENLYNCQFYKAMLGEKDILELHTLNKLTKDNITHIRYSLKQLGYYFYMMEAVDDYLMITYYKK